MGLEEIVNLFVNNGIGVICIAYFMFRDYHFMQKLTDTLSSLTATFEELKKATRMLEGLEEERSNHDH